MSSCYQIRAIAEIRQLWQCWILNPLCWARDPTCVLVLPGWGINAADPVVLQWELLIFYFFSTFFFFFLGGYYFKESGQGE